MFAKFFPTAPSVLQQKKSRSKSAQEKKHVGSSALDVHQDPSPAPGFTAQVSAQAATGEGETFVTFANDGANFAEPTSMMQDESEHAQGDLLNGVGSASSTSTASSVFSGTNHPPTMANYGGAQSFLTPLTNSDSSPSGKAVSPPPVISTCAKTPPEVTSTRLEGTVQLAPASPIAVAGSNIQPLLRLTARPSGREVKGSRAIYDPELDKKLSSKERRSRKVQYRDFGEEVSPSQFSNGQRACSIIEKSLRISSASSANVSNTIEFHRKTPLLPTHACQLRITHEVPPTSRNKGSASRRTP